MGFRGVWWVELPALKGNGGRNKGAPGGCGGLGLSALEAKTGEG